jgi:DNA-binding MarR family transcriptional regulator
VTRSADEPHLDPEVPDLVTDAVFQASRAMVAIAARSLARVDDDVTLVQFRALVVLSDAREANLAQLADALGITASTATRLCDRLVDHGLIRREPLPDDRRRIRLSLTEAGRRVVDRVSRDRRRDLRRILAHMPARDRDRLVPALEAFTRATTDSLGLRWPDVAGGGPA